MSDEIGFLEKINEVYAKLDAIIEASDLFDAEIVDRLDALAEIDISLISADLKKGNYLGDRKLDIDLSLNNQNEDEECTYKNITLTLNTGDKVSIDFTAFTDEGDEVVEEISSYTALYTNLIEGIKAYNLEQNDAQKRVVNYEIDVINETIDSPTILRIRDTDGTACNIDDISLTWYSQGNPISINPSYSWIDTTSALEVLANKVPDLLELGASIQDITKLADKDDEMQYLYDNRTTLTDIKAIGDEIETLAINIQEILDARDYALRAEDAANELANLDPEVVLLASGQSASISYNSTTGKFIVYMPKGDKGDTGEPFTIGATGNTAGKSSYDSASKDFTYLDTSTGEIYFKLSDTLADWSSGFPFLGLKGDEGVSLLSITLIDVSGTNYLRFTKDDATYTDILINKSMLGLGNVNNTSDANKPISNATSSALALKLDKSSILDDLTYSDTDKALSANQGKTLKALIDNINAILTSDDSTLDELQEIVSYIKQNKTDLQSLGMANIAGLTSALADKQDALTSGTNIKAINSQSLLGSGNLTLQELLVSGTNIKTINSENVLGNGNIEIVTTLTDSVATTDSTTGASATAVKTAYDKGVSAYSLANSKLGSIPSSISSIGSYALVVCSNNTGAGSTRSGSQLKYGGVDGSNSVSSSGGTLSGTWRMMGDSDSSNDQLTLAIRIA